MPSTLNLDQNTELVVPYREPTPEEEGEIAVAKFVITEIGKSFVQAYTDDRARAVDYALYGSLTRMLEDGLEIHIDGFGSNKRMEFRVSEDRRSTIVTRIFE